MPYHNSSDDIKGRIKKIGQVMSTRIGGIVHANPISGAVARLARDRTQHDIRPVLSRDDTHHHQQSVGKCGKIVVVVDAYGIRLVNGRTRDGTK